jgi:hypothetical protein
MMVGTVVMRGRAEGEEKCECGFAGQRCDLEMEDLVIGMGRGWCCQPFKKTGESGT